MAERLEPTRENIEKMAKEIYDFLIENGMWYDTTITFNGKTMTTSLANGEWGDGKRFQVLENETEQRDGFILSMTFEGPLHQCLNYNYEISYCDKISNDLAGIFNKYDCYYELGHSYDLEAYRI